jgi:hypothetical protein
MRKSYQEIADAMGGGLTKDAVASQAQRMGWSQPAEDTRARLAISAVKGSAAKTANSFWRNNQRKLKELSGFVGSGVSDADIAAKLNAPEEFIQHGMKLLTKFPAPP